MKQIEIEQEIEVLSNAVKALNEIKRLRPEARVRCWNYLVQHFDPKQDDDNYTATVTP